MEEDLKRIKACLEFEDYYSILEYITLIVENYTGTEKEFLLKIVKNIKSGNYKEVHNLLKS